jgi:WD40 repeat protein
MSTQPAVGYWITIPQNASSSSEIFYINQKGEVIQITEPAKEKVVASSNFGVPLRVLQNIDGSRVIVFFDSGKKAIFNTASKVWQEIDSEITSVTFSPDGNSIAFLKSNGSQTSIYIQNVSTSKKSVTLVANLSILDFSILWPSSNQLVLVSKPSNKFLGEAWYLNLKTKTLNFLHSGKGLDLVYSLKSNYGLKFSAADRTRTDVSIVDKNGNKLADMPFSSIGVKCAFAQLEPLAYCAIPLRFSIDQPLMPDDYFKKAVFTNDTIYKIDLASSIVTKVIDDQTAPIDGVDLRASSSTLYFINRLDGLLYSFSL